MTDVRRGREALQELLAAQLFDLRELSVDRFPAWLERHLAHWRSDPAFVQRVRIRDIRREHPELNALEAERREARTAYEASPAHAAIEAAEKELAGAANAVAGLTYALGRAQEEERRRLALKLERFSARAAALNEELRELTDASPEWRALGQIGERLARVRKAVGFAREVEALNKLQRSQGRSSGRSGAAFERAAVEVVREVIVPELDGALDGPPPVILSGVTLGAARMELDQLVVRPSTDPNGEVEVLALLESKRNPNDLAHGLLRRLENLAWLARHEAGYDAEAQRTATFRTGHFDVVAAHEEGGSRYRIASHSFRRFLPDLRAGDLPRGLYLITRSVPLWGIGSGGLARIAHRVSSDLAWDPDDPDYLAELLRWCTAMTREIEAPDVLRRHAADPDSARRVLILDE